MLSIYLWRVKVIHSFKYLIKEVVRSENSGQVRLLVLLLIEGIAVVHGIIRVVWLPSFQCDKIVVEDFLGVDADQPSIHVVRNSTTIVTISDQALNGWPWNRIFLVKRLVDWFAFFILLSHVDCKDIFADIVVRLIECVVYVPA